MKNRSVMTHAFSQVPNVTVPRSVFNRTHGYKTCFDAGLLIPFYVDEAVPGDSFSMKCSLLIRLLSPSIKPFMDNLWIDTFWFFVPLRLLWTNFKKFMGEQDNPGDGITSYVVPQVTSPNVAGGGIPVGHLFDYMGLPTGPLGTGGGTTGLTFNNLHGRAYNQIFNEWFRSEILQNSVQKDIGDGPDTFANYNLLRRGKRFDYFTSGLPWLQKGGTAISIPMASSAPVKGIGMPQGQVWDSNASVTFRESDGTARIIPVVSHDNFTNAAVAGLAAGSNSYPNIYADLTLATATTINALRESITLQQFLEKDARGGTRYTELIKSHFGVTSPDARLQRPELLATYSSPFRITPVANTNGLTADYSPDGEPKFQGELAGFGTGSFVGHGFTKSFTEHGVLLGLISVRADLTYQQGMDRMWFRRTRYDFYWPVFANLGEQVVYNKEIFANCPDGTSSTQKDGVFAYQERHAEYRYKPSKITSILRSTAMGSLDVWHLSQYFATLPTLGTSFIQDDPPIDRVIAVPAQPHFMMDALLNLKTARPMPMFSVPGLKRL